MKMVQTDLCSKAHVVKVYVAFSPAECVRVSVPPHHSGILLLLRALIILQSHAGLVRGTCFNLLCQLGSTCFSFKKLFRVVPLQWNSGEDTKLWPYFDLLQINTFTYAEKCPQKVNATYVYVDKLLSYVDKMPYFSSLNLNISLGSHPFDWCKHTGGKREEVSQTGAFFSSFCIVKHADVLKNHQKVWWWVSVEKFSQR